MGIDPASNKVLHMEQDNTRERLSVDRPVFVLNETDLRKKPTVIEDDLCSQAENVPSKVDVHVRHACSVYLGLYLLLRTIYTMYIHVYENMGQNQYK